MPQSRKESDLSNESSHTITVLNSFMISEHQAESRCSFRVHWRSGDKCEHEEDFERGNEITNRGTIPKLK